MSTDEIDSLLERYLCLLDEYTALRTELNCFQSSIYQDIARANFSADRGIRYGQDYYDDRQRATRHVQLNPDTPTSFIVTHSAPPATSIPTTAPATDVNQDGTDPANTAPRARFQNLDPIRMFGILTPPPLRSAQSSAITMVEELVPRLATVDAEMREMEIRIRRARKYFAKGRTSGAGKATLESSLKGVAMS